MKGVLLMAYGTPAGPGEVEAYYTDIRRGRPPTPEQLADLRRRYDAIGGVSPLRQRTEAQAAALSSALGPGWRVALGMKHAAPSIADGVAALGAAGVTSAVGLVLAPHYSALSIGEYVERAAKAAGELGLAVTFVESWHLAPGYVELLASRVRDGLASLPRGSHVVVTAHSLPARILDTGDPYPVQLRETATAIAELAGVGAGQWSVAWQSAGRTPEPWLGPDILDVVDHLAAEGAPGVLICPAGFVSDHLEVQYDLDVDAARVARDRGIAFARTAMPNDDPAFIETLAAEIRRAG
ncbi:MAG: ferrochelatase [Acidimicrobiales bacterium]|nr:ferrochelatase [Acidimicrobiales bacterium]